MSIAAVLVALLLAVVEWKWPRVPTLRTALREQLCSAWARLSR